MMWIFETSVGKIRIDKRNDPQLNTSLAVIIFSDLRRCLALLSKTSGKEDHSSKRLIEYMGHLVSGLHSVEPL